MTFNSNKSLHHLLTVVVFICSATLVLTQNITTSSATEQNQPRPPPRIPHAPLITSSLFTDQSDYVALGDHVGTTLALGDFTSDRYTDLLVVNDARVLRSVHVLVWHHHTYTFARPSTPHHSSFSPTFSLDTVPGMSSSAVIASAAAFDANSDGLLDAILSVRLSETEHLGIVLLGDGSGCLRFDQILPDIHPGLLIMDANDDMLHDIFVTTPKGDRLFFVNGPPGVFSRRLWTPWGNHLECVPTYPFNSNAYVDVDGDCQPDLVVTSSCGMEVWLNAEARHTRGSAWANVQTFPKDRHDFTNMSYARQHHRIHILPRGVWSAEGGDGRATFADLDGDGAIDIAVPNKITRTLRVSFLHRATRLGRRLCAADPRWRFVTRPVLYDFDVSDSGIGPTVAQSRVHVGDFNFDGLADLLLLDGESGTLQLFVARHASGRQAWFAGASNMFDRLLFPILGRSSKVNSSEQHFVHYAPFADSFLLQHIEDPLAAAFFDVDESGRQDILIVQQHGTRLIWNNYQKIEDAVFFKATGVNIARRNGKNAAVIESASGRYFSRNVRPAERRQNKSESGEQALAEAQALSPPPGLTFKISYGGRTGRETQVCTQCPQTGVLSLQACSCLFGITNIANYIEEMAMGGVGGVRTSSGLMPNALAVVWPERETTGSGLRWRVSYLSKGREGQVRRIVIALLGTLVVLFFAILFIHGMEAEGGNDKLTVGYT